MDNNIETLKKFVGLVTDGYAKPRLARIVRVKGARADVNIVRNDGSIDDDYPEIPNCPLPSRLTDNSGYFGAPVQGALCLVVFSSGDISKPYIVAVYTDVAADSVVMRNGTSEIKLEKEKISIQSGSIKIIINDSGVTLSTVALEMNGEIFINGNINCSGTVNAANIP
jgi:hypothetical protein